MIAVGLFLAACGGEPAPKYHGFLYFGAGGYLGKFSLRDGSSSIVVSVGDANVREVDALHGSRLLLSLDAIENNRDVAKIVWFDTRTFQQSALYAGVAAVWLPDVHTYIYDDGSRLSAASTHRDFITDNVVMEHRINELVDILVISPASAVFQIGLAEHSRVWRYDAGLADLSELAELATTCSLRHAAWVKSREQLACRSRTTGAYILVGLDGETTQTLALPDEREFEILEYVPDQELLVLVEPWRTTVFKQPRTAVWVYELESGETHRIAKHQYLGRSAAYRRE